MNNQDIDPDNLPSFQLPDSVLDEIYELTVMEISTTKDL